MSDERAAPDRGPSPVRYTVATQTEVRDPRHWNEVFDRTSISSYLSGYASKLMETLASVDPDELERARLTIEEAALAGRRLFVVGNGGSAAIADHLCCDWTKGTHTGVDPTIDTFSLSANTALYSAIANDYGFDQVFSTQVGFFGRPGDVLVAISSSGNSKNILSAVQAARERGMVTIGLCGFGGGRLSEASDIVLNVTAHNYGVVEDAHQALIHVLSQFIVLAREDGVA